jgi:hypothetical protein
VKALALLLGGSCTLRVSEEGKAHWSRPERPFRMEPTNLRPTSTFDLDRPRVTSPTGDFQYDFDSILSPPRVSFRPFPTTSREVGPQPKWGKLTDKGPTSVTVGNLGNRKW